MHDLITEDTLTELSILRENIEVILNCTIEDSNVRVQTLIYIANDYLIKMGEMIQTMQKSMMKAPQ